MNGWSIGFTFSSFGSRLLRAVGRFVSTAERSRCGRAHLRCARQWPPFLDWTAAFPRCQGLATRPANGRLRINGMRSSTGSHRELAGRVGEETEDDNASRPLGLGHGHLLPVDIPCSVVPRQTPVHRHSTPGTAGSFLLPRLAKPQASQEEAVNCATKY